MTHPERHGHEPADQHRGQDRPAVVGRQVAVVKPPTPAKVTLQSQIMPPSPVTRVKDRKMMP